MAYAQSRHIGPADLVGRQRPHAAHRVAARAGMMTARPCNTTRLQANDGACSCNRAQAAVRHRARRRGRIAVG
jgi:hypothetical protein